MAKKKQPSPGAGMSAGPLLAHLGGANPTEQDMQRVLGALGPGPAGGDPFGGTGVIPLPDPPDDPVTFTVRVDLQGAKPPIWRMLELPGELTLDLLHHVLQTAMGWQDCHLHNFELHTGSSRPGPFFLNGWDEQRGEQGTPERAARLDQVVASVGDKLHYEYDFGDGWGHLLAVTKVERRHSGRARCLRGRGACPPEDCGGIWGYQDLLDVLATPAAQRSEDAKELLAWVGGDFDPAGFDAKEVDRALGALPPVPSAAPGSAGADPGPPAAGRALPAALTSLLGTGRPLPADLLELIDAARLDEAAAEPSPQVAATLVTPWVVLLREVGAGLKLTAAGYLPPASVKRIYDRLGLDAHWIGKGNREDQTLPVAELRRSGQALGLIRKRKGELLPTAAGKRLAGDPDALLAEPTDPQALLRHIQDRFPLGREDFDIQAALLLLLTVATGAHPYVGVERAAAILQDLGWRTDIGGVPAMAVRDRADLTYGILELLHDAAGGAEHADPPVTPDAVRDLARRVLRGDGATVRVPAAAPAGVAGDNVTPLRGGEPADVAAFDPATVEEAMDQLSSTFLDAIHQARRPLEAELVLCEAFASVELSAPVGVDAATRAQGLVLMLGQLLTAVEQHGGPDALGLLRVASVLGPEATRAAARAGAERLAAAGVPDRQWAGRVGRPRPLRAWHYGDSIGFQDSVGALFDYQGREHVVTVLIDHTLGGGVKDCWVAEGKQAKGLHDLVRREVQHSGDQYFEDISPRRAGELLRDALASPPCPADDEQVEDVATYLHLLRCRVERVLLNPGGAG